MSGFKTPAQRRGLLTLWSRKLDDAPPAGHPVRLLDHLLGLDPFKGAFKQWEADYNLTEGKPPYHPSLPAALYVYGMMNGIRSSRRLERAAYNRIGVVRLLSGERPDHATIAAFVGGHKERLRRLPARGPPLQERRQGTRRQTGPARRTARANAPADGQPPGTRTTRAEAPERGAALRPHQAERGTAPVPAPRAGGGEDRMAAGLRGAEHGNPH